MLGPIAFGAYALFIVLVWLGMLLLLRDGETTPKAVGYFFSGAVLHIVLVVFALVVFK